MYQLLLRGALGAGAIVAASAAAFAHPTFERAEAPANSTYRAVIRLGHGCDGSPTTAVRVAVPEGVIAAKPMPKAGWTVAVTKGPYARTYPYFHGPLAEGAKEIAWSGGSLPGEHYDEFVFSARVTDAFAPGTIVYFPVIQDCETGSHRWVEVPRPGENAQLKEPAPGLRILAAADEQGQTVYKADGLTVEAPWSRATPGGAKVAGGYLTITNSGTQPDRLVGGTLAAAETAEVHEMAIQDGIMRMRPLEKGLVIPAGGSVALKPGGIHIMFMGLKSPLKEGDSVKGTLAFEKAGTVAVDFRVRGIGASGGGGSEHRH